MPRRTKKSKKLPSVAKALAGKEARSKKSTTESSKTVKKPKKVQLPVRIKKSLVRSVKLAGEKLKEEKKPEAVKKVEQSVKETSTISVQAKKKQTQAKKHIDPEKTERDKRLMMWAGVAFFMVLIFGVWIFNLKNVFKTTQSTDTNSSAVQEWDKIADEFSATLEKVKEGIAELKEVETEEEGGDIFSESAQISDEADRPATTSESIDLFEQDEIAELKARLEELESKSESGEEQATSTP